MAVSRYSLTFMAVTLCASEAQPARTSGMVPPPPYKLLHLTGIVDLRDEQSRRARIQGFLDHDLIQRRDAHHARNGIPGGLKEGFQIVRVERAVLRIDEKPVKPDLGQDFGHIR